jgi:hypothetical protein
LRLSACQAPAPPSQAPAAATGEIPAIARVLAANALVALAFASRGVAAYAFGLLTDHPDR